MWFRKPGFALSLGVLNRVKNNSLIGDALKKHNEFVLDNPYEFLFLQY